MIVVEGYISPAAQRHMQAQVATVPERDWASLTLEEFKRLRMPEVIALRMAAPEHYAAMVDAEQAEAIGAGARPVSTAAGAE